MSTGFRKATTLSLAAALSCAVPGARVFAQSTPAASDPDETVRLEKFVTTGSVIPTPESETFSPVVSYSPEKLNLQGAALPIEALRVMPGFIGSVNTEQRTNGGTGAASVNLRGLAGTLSLLDGHRSAGFDNFNVLPVIALSRIEIVKDGASAVYGSDALSGVFNVVLVPRFDGVKIDTYYGNTTDKDSGVLRTGILAGATRGATNVVVGFEHYQRNALYAHDRAVSANADGRDRGGKNQGSATFPGRVTARVGSATAPVQDLVLKPGLTAGYTSDDFVPIDTNPSTSNQLLNFRQYTPSIPEQEHNSVYARLNQSFFHGKVEAFARVLYSRDVFYNGLAPAPMPTGGSQGTALRNVTRQSPHTPTGLFVGTSSDTGVSPGAITNGTLPFRTLVLGPRTQTWTRDVWDFNAGLTGRFGRDWTWSATYIYSDLYRDYTQGGLPSLAKLSTHILDGSFNPYALDTAKGTNPNNGLAYDNPKSLADSTATGNQVQHYPTRGGAVNAAGTVWELPTGEIKLGAGGDYYHNNVTELPDAVLNSGDLLGANPAAKTISSSHSYGEFLELQVPLLGNSVHFPAVRSLSLSLAGRHDHQSVYGYANGNSGALLSHTFNSNNPKVGLRWEVTDDLLVRGTWATGFRLPSLNSLFRGAGAGSQVQLIDPLGYPIQRQTSTTLQGNPDLSPEKSLTYSTGFVYAPKQVAGLSISVDYYWGKIKGLVGEGAQYILNLNAAGQGSNYVAGNPATLNPDAPFANRINRSPSGSVQSVASTYFNIAARETDGVDTAITYALPTGIGKFTTRLDWTSVLSWNLTPLPGYPKQSFVGVYLDVSNNGISPGSVPRNKGSLTEQWEKGDWTVVLTGNYISRLRDDPNFSTVTGTVRYLEHWFTVDTQVAYKLHGGPGWRKWLDHTTVRVGVSNLLDEDPPYAAGAFNDSYDVTTYSNRGRFWYTEITKKF